MSRPLPLLIAHRGESFDAPENTLAAFNLAWQRGDDGIELDVHCTADAQLVVCHDPDTLRTAGVKHMLCDCTLAALRTLNVGSWKSPAFAAERMVSLADVLTAMPAGKQAFIEIKCGVEAIEPLASLLATLAHPPSAIAIISFYPDVIAAVKQGLPLYPAYWLVSPTLDANTQTWSPDAATMIAHARSIQADGLNISEHFPIDQPFVAAVHSAGLRLLVWTVDDPNRARDLLSLQIDGLTTNRAAWLRAQLALPASQDRSVSQHEGGQKFIS